LEVFPKYLIILGEEDKNLEENIIYGKLTVPFYVSDDCVDLLNKIFINDSEERLNIAQFLAHKWLTEEEATE